MEKFFNSIFNILKFKKIKQSILIYIAIVVATLLTLPRVLLRSDIAERISDSFTVGSIKDIIFRFVFSVIYLWAVLHFNANFKVVFTQKSKIKRVLFIFLINASLFLITSIVFNYLYPAFTGQIMPLSELGFTYFIIFVVICILVAVSWILRYKIIHKEDMLQNEILNQQRLRSELAALKNQVNPHFLFNSFNSLSILVRGNEEATLFVNKQSFMYRYILESGDQDFVTVKDELEFLESYIYLIQTRYRDRFNISINIDDDLLNIEIPVLAIQLLVENAVKHNEISYENPLKVFVRSEDRYIVIENDLRPRNTFVDSTGKGLANLNKRYELLKGKPISILKTEQKFIVKLPLI